MLDYEVVSSACKAVELVEIDANELHKINEAEKKLRRIMETVLASLRDDADSPLSDSEPS